MASPKVEQRFRVIPGTRTIPLSLDVQAFLIDRQAQGLSPGTLRYYRQKLNLLQQYLLQQGITDVAQVTPNVLRAYIAAIRQDHNPGGTLLAFRAAATFFKWLAEEGVVSDNPMGKLKAPKVPEQVLEPVPIENVKAMVATCGKDFNGQRDKAILLALLDSGCRASEFVALNIGDVDLSSGAVVVRKAKGGKPRAIFLGNKTRREVIRYLRHRPDAASDAPLWVTDEGPRLTYNGLRQVVRRRAERAGVQEPSLHSFRRAFALLSLRGGMDIYSLQKLMGHADLSTLYRYLAQTKTDLQQAHRKAGPVDNLL